MLGKFISTRLAVVVGTAAVALLPNFVERITEAIDWRIFAIAGGYIVANTAQNIFVAVLDYKKNKGGS